MIIMIHPRIDFQHERNRRGLYSSSVFGCSCGVTCIGKLSFSHGRNYNRYHCIGYFTDKKPSCKDLIAVALSFIGIMFLTLLPF